MTKVSFQVTRELTPEEVVAEIPLEMKQEFQLAAMVAEVQLVAWANESHSLLDNPSIMRSSSSSSALVSSATVQTRSFKAMRKRRR